ncbi:MAG: hypothetical protein ABJP34_00240 [Erythrobacter sp.]
MHGKYSILKLAGLTAGLIAALGVSAAAHNYEHTSWRLSVAAVGQEQAELSTLVNTTVSVLESDAFFRNLKDGVDQSDIIARDFKVVSGAEVPVPISVEELTSILQFKQSGMWKFRQSVTLMGTYWNQGPMYIGQCSNPAGPSPLPCKRAKFTDNNTNQFATNRAIKPGEDTLLEILIGRELHKRYLKDDPFKKSCAINTLSHEILHGFAPDTGKIHTTYFRDTDANGQRFNSQSPLATYYVGSVAQCTWLQRKGLVGNTKTELRTCLARYGTNEFLSNQCDD